MANFVQFFLEHPVYTCQLSVLVVTGGETDSHSTDNWWSLTTIQANYTQGINVLYRYDMSCTLHEYIM